MLCAIESVMQQTLSPSPLWGGSRAKRAGWGSSQDNTLFHPTPNPSPQGGGEFTARVAPGAMLSKIRWAWVAGALLAAAAGSAHARSADLVSIQTPRGVQQAFILVAASQKPVASVILFAGGHGALGLTGASSMNWGVGNFLVSTRNMFAARGFMVAVVDAPSDQKHGMNAIFRMTPAHARDIE